MARGGADVEVWPECLPALELMRACGTQWQLGGMGGVVGLRYEAVSAVMDMRAVPSVERAALLDDLRVMEQAMLEVWNK